MKTEVLKVNRKNPEKGKIERAANLIQRGELVAFPTETVYGLGANAFDARAVKKIFKAKGRPADNPLIVHISDMDMLDALVERIPEKAIPLMEKFWPGPLTLVMKKKRNVPDAVTAGGNTIGVRMPKNRIARALIKKSGTPIAAPSANASTRPSPTEANHVYEDLSGRIPLILDGGKTDVGIESTVLDLTSRTPAILRKGKIARSDVKKVIGAVVDHTQKKRGKVKSPGQKYRHYAPKAKLVFAREGISAVRRFISKNKEKKVFVITHLERKNSHRGAYRTLPWGKKSNVSAAARKFFSLLRRCDQEGADVILIENPPRKGIGDALYDRISRGGKRIV